MSFLNPKIFHTAVLSLSAFAVSVLVFYQFYPAIIRSGSVGIDIYLILIGYQITKLFLFSDVKNIDNLYKVIFNIGLFYLVVIIAVLICTTAVQIILHPGTDLFENFKVVAVIVYYLLLLAISCFWSHELTRLNNFYKTVCLTLLVLVCISVYFIGADLDFFKSNGLKLFELYFGTILAYLAKAVDDRQRTFLNYGDRCILASGGIIFLITSVLTKFSGILNTALSIFGTIFILLSRMNTKHQIEPLLDNVLMKYLGESAFIMYLVYYPVYATLQHGQNHYFLVQHPIYVIILMFMVSVTVRLLIQEPVYLKYKEGIYDTV
ncbi:MAG: hypothetical protein LBI63_05805 [Candidatus Ancillula sp.]|jgi:peptidoglycan/LPS O-acetylase OafA/YrhL|nr:hypothetical protein [Candidatus Ancillula sp.]